jgi:Na+/H+ antiporter NhaD/arsenite permease-like protein
MEVTWIFTLIFSLVILLIFTEVIHRTLAALIGAVLTIWFGLQYKVFTYEEIFQFIDLNTIIFIIGVFIIISVLESSGIFHFIGLKVVNIVGTNPKILLITLTLLTALFSFFIENIPTMLILGSLTIIIMKNLNYDPTPYLIAEFIGVDIGGLALLISSVPNIIVGSVTRISFSEFMLTSLPFVAISLLISIFLLLIILKKDIEKEKIKILEKYDAWTAVKDKRVFYRSLILFIIILITFFFYEKLGVGMEIIAFVGGVILLLISGVSIEETFRHIDWTTIFFLSGFFIIIGGIEKAGLLEAIASQIVLIAKNDILYISFLLLWVSGLASGVMDNIPVTITLIRVTNEISNIIKTNINPLWWSIIFGANLGGILTAIASPAGIIAMGILEKEDYPVSPLKFMKKSAPICIILLIVATLYIFIRFFI